MSNTKREPLLSGDVIPIKLRSPEEINAMHEKARAKDAELIQQLVDALEWVAAYDNGCPLPTWERGYNNAWSIANSARAAAKAAGFKPSDQ
jgi:hypothetical protein